MLCHPATRLFSLLCAALLLQTPVSCDPAPVAEHGYNDKTECVRLLAKWKTPQEGGPLNRDETRAKLQKRFPTIEGWQIFSHIPDVVVIELNPAIAAAPAAVEKIQAELLQTGFFHYVEPDSAVKALPGR